jgi:hypothetical protein
MGVAGAVRGQSGSAQVVGGGRTARLKRTVSGQGGGLRPEQRDREGRVGSGGLGGSRGVSAAWRLTSACSGRAPGARVLCGW